MDNKELITLFDDFVKGNRNAFVEIYNDMKVPVYTVAYRIVGSVDTAEDITQEIFVRLFTSPINSNVKNPRAFIFKMTHNLSIDALRKNNSTEEKRELSDAEPFTDGIDAQLDLENAISQLSNIEAEIVMLHLNAELTFSEIAQIMHLSLPAVYRRYKKALKALKIILNGGLK